MVKASIGVDLASETGGVSLGICLIATRVLVETMKAETDLAKGAFLRWSL